MAKIPINNFDKFIKGKVETHQTPVDTDRLWSNIQKTGTGRKAGILPGALLLILISLFVSVHLMNNRNSVENTAKLDDSHLMASAMNTENLPLQTANPERTSTKEISPEIKGDSDAPLGNVAFQVKKQSSSKSRVAKTQIQKNPQAKILHSGTLELVDNSVNVSTETVNEPTLSSNILTESPANHDISSELLSVGQVSLSNKELENFTLSAELDSLANLDIESLQNELFFPEMTLFPNSASRIQRTNYKKGLEIRINGGAGKVIRNMNLINREAEQWMQSRKDNEEQLESFRLGIDVRFKISKNVYFFAGIEDLRINERFNYESFEERTYFKDDELARIVHDEFTYRAEHGKVLTHEEIHKKGTFYNQFRMINIPFGVGLTQQFGRFGLGVEGAILINAFHQFDGKIADAANNLMDLKHAGLKVSQIQTARINGVFSYQLSSRWGLNLITGADLPIKSVQLGQHMSQNYMLFQGNLGICYNW
jgi:hypothetical protein